MFGSAAACGARRCTKRGPPPCSQKWPGETAAVTVIPAHPAAAAAVVTALPVAVQAIQVEVAAAVAAAAAAVVVQEAVVGVLHQVSRRKGENHPEIPGGEKKKSTLKEERELPHMGTTG